MKLIQIIAINRGTQDQTVLAHGPKSELLKLGCKASGKVIRPTLEMLKELPDGETFDITNEITDLTRQMVEVGFPSFMLEWLQSAAYKNKCTIGSVIQSLVLDQIDREEPKAEVQDAAVSAGS